MRLDRNIISNFPTRPGVYQMYNQEGDVIYVGKAKNLKKRLSSYFRPARDRKTTVLMQQVTAIKTIVTATENEALLLENTLIKRLKPRYNIDFKDDKSFPYIFISDHEFPCVTIHRGAKKERGSYYGPYSNAKAARETLHILQRSFKLRNCSDTNFRNRSRPCVQYQMRRCLAPCVGLITKAEYLANIVLVKKILSGKNKLVTQEIKKKMQQASLKLDFESAALYRDQLESLNAITEKQYVTKASGNADIIALASLEEKIAIALLFICEGRVIGSKIYFPSNKELAKEAEILQAFIIQYYSEREAAKQQLICNIKVSNRAWLESALGLTISCGAKGVKGKWLAMATMNAKEALISKRKLEEKYLHYFQEVKKILNLDLIPQNIECFDISHTGGEATVASCVVFDRHGAKKAQYRRFNIKGVVKGDDYGALEQALTRRYQSGVYPDIIMIDGGKGQLNRAIKILDRAKVIILAIAKGEGRKSGLETIYMANKVKPVELASDSLAFHLLQEIRDEAHRFAITGHRSKRTKARLVSMLENIPGIGAKKRQALLQKFGGLREVQMATIEELKKIPGIKQQLAERVYEALHD